MIFAPVVPSANALPQQSEVFFICHDCPIEISHRHISAGLRFIKLVPEDRY